MGPGLAPAGPQAGQGRPPTARGKRIHKAGWKASRREALFPGALLEQLAQAQLSSVTRYTAEL